MKKYKLIFLSLAFVSLSAFSSADGTTDPFADFEKESYAAVHPVMQEKNDFLFEIEQMQKNITLMQLELKEKQLQYQVEEQEKKMKELSEAKTEETSALSELPKFNPNSFASVPGMPSTELLVTSVRGVADDLHATIVSDVFGMAVVKEGDVLANGSTVTRISKNSVTIENLNGDTDVLGINFR